MNFQCQSCQSIISVGDADLGSQVLCCHCNSATRVPNDYSSPGAVLDDFLILSKLGVGGVGTVHLAHQFSLDRDVALKILHPQFALNREFVVDFVREARNAAKLNHPNVVQAYAVGSVGQTYYIALELVHGESVKDILDREGQLEVRRALQITRDVTQALDHAWQTMELVHRDIKPDNVMIRKDGKTKLADLGLAKPVSELNQDDEDIQATPQYLCPENIMGTPMDIRGDVYSLGATLYHMITGEFPFDGDTGIEIARKHVTEPVRPPREICPDLPACVSDLIIRMMKKNPSDRQRGPKALTAEIDDCLNQITRSLKRVRRKKKSHTTGTIRRRRRIKKIHTAQTKNQTAPATAETRLPAKSSKRNLYIALGASIAIIASAIGAAVLSTDKTPYAPENLPGFTVPHNR